MSSTTQTVKYSAIAAMEAKGAMQPWSYTPMALRPNDVEIKIHACGVCHSDLHQVHNDWGIATYPMVPGHEIIGDVIAIGSAVTELRVGQRVGVTPQVSCCKVCDDCVRGETQLCKKQQWNYGFPTGDATQPITYGGFASHTRVNEHWAFPIPDALPTIAAAPLLCAGITTWSPFVHHKITSKHRVGIIGVGGLGHIGLQFSVKLGAHTTGISTSNNKRDEVLRFGAQAFINSSDEKDMKAAAGSFDFLLSTISSDGVNWDNYLDLLKTDGILCFLGAPKEMKFSPIKVLLARLTITGSPISSNAEIRKMLEFCGRHNIVAQTEERPMTAEGANQALAKVEANTARYRMVLVNKSS